jgi:hypothetical protein
MWRKACAFRCLFSQTSRPVAKLRSLTTLWYVSKCLLTSRLKKIKHVFETTGGPCVRNSAYYPFVDFLGDRRPVYFKTWMARLFLFFQFVSHMAEPTGKPFHTKVRYPQSHLPEATVDTYFTLRPFSQTTTLTTCSAMVNGFQSLFSPIRKQ